MKALEDGRVRPEGIELDFLNLRLARLHSDFATNPN